MPIAIVHKRLSLLWAAPLLLWLFLQGSGNGTTFQTTWTLAVAALVVLLLLRVPPTKANADRLPAPPSDAGGVPKKRNARASSTHSGRQRDATNPYLVWSAEGGNRTPTPRRGPGF